MTRSKAPLLLTSGGKDNYTGVQKDYFTSVAVCVRLSILLGRRYITVYVERAKQVKPAMFRASM